MLEAYSTNQTIATNGTLPFNATKVVKGKTATLNGVSSIQLNKAGVYEITLSISGLPSEAGDVTISPQVNGVVQANNINIPTVVTTAGVSATLSTLVRVLFDNTCSCLSSPTSVSFLNSGVGLANFNCNVVVTKLC